jgi:enoyl-CoA hydratase/carnithine racemase
MMTATALMTGAVRAEIRGNIGVITLNRAKALNALTTAMVEAIDAVLREWATTGLHAVVLDSASPRAFCAGGDICAIRENSLAGDQESSQRFFHRVRSQRPHRYLSCPVHLAHRRNLYGRRNGPVGARNLPRRQR